jgi:hypothetical protein
MEYANNIHAMTSTYFVEDDMDTYRKSTVADTNVITCFTKLVVLSQLVKSMVKLGQALVSLLTDPSLLGELRNGFQASLYRHLYPEVSH